MSDIKIWTKIKDSLIFNILLVLLLIMVGYSAYRMVEQALILWKEREATEKRIAELTAQKQKLETDLAGLSAPAAIERKAKERFNLKRPGEEVVVVVEGEKKEKSATSSPTLWQRIGSLLKFP